MYREREKKKQKGRKGQVYRTKYQIRVSEINDDSRNEVDNLARKHRAEQLYPGCIAVRIINYSLFRFVSFCFASLNTVRPKRSEKKPKEITRQMVLVAGVLAKAGLFSASLFKARLIYPRVRAYRRNCSALILIPLQRNNAKLCSQKLCSR